MYILNFLYSVRMHPVAVCTSHTNLELITWVQDNAILIINVYRTRNNNYCICMIKGPQKRLSPWTFPKLKLSFKGLGISHHDA